MKKPYEDLPHDVAIIWRIREIEDAMEAADRKLKRNLTALRVRRWWVNGWATRRKRKLKLVKKVA